MNFEQIVQLISNVGFPIVMCGALCYYVYKQSHQNNQAIEDLKDVVSELKAAIQQLLTKLEEK